MQQLASNLSNSSALDSNTPSVHAQEEPCFLFDVNFNSTHYLYVTHILTSVVNTLFSSTAIAGNAVVIFTMWKTPSLHSPSNMFIGCLAVSDLTVGLFAQPCFVVHKVGEILHRLEMYCITRILLESLGNITTGASVLTMAGATIERCLALYFHLRYNEIVTARRVLFAVACFWIVLIALATFRMFLIRPEIYNTILVTTISLSLLSTYLAYAKILQCVRQHERRIYAEAMGASMQIEERTGRLGNIIRYKKSTVTMIFVVGIFTACFLPMLCVKLVHRLCGYTVPVKTAYLFASTIAFLNSSLNPVVYCWRITSLRHAVKTVFKNRLCKRGV